MIIMCMSKDNIINVGWLEPFISELPLKVIKASGITCVDENAVTINI